MIALGKGVCSDEKVALYQPHLARIGEDYFVILPCLKNPAEEAEARRRKISVVPLSDAYYLDYLDSQVRSCKGIHEIHPIH